MNTVEKVARKLCSARCKVTEACANGPRGQGECYLWCNHTFTARQLVNVIIDDQAAGVAIETSVMDTFKRARLKV